MTATTQTRQPKQLKTSKPKSPKPLVKSEIYYESTPGAGEKVYGIYTRRKYKGNQFVLFRLHHTVEGDEAKQKFVATLMESADKEGKPLEVNIQTGKAHHSFSDKFDA